MLDGLLDNIDAFAAKLGIPTEQAHALAATVKGKIGDGHEILPAITAAAQEHGLSLDSLQGLIQSGAGKGQDVLGQIGGMLDRDGDGNPMNDLSGMAKGLFGSKD